MFDCVRMVEKLMRECTRGNHVKAAHYYAEKLMCMFGMALLGAITPITAAHATDIYQWVNAQGQVNFSSRPSTQFESNKVVQKVMRPSSAKKEAVQVVESSGATESPLKKANAELSLEEMSQALAEKQCQKQKQLYLSLLKSSSVTAMQKAKRRKQMNVKRYLDEHCVATK